MKSAQYQLSFRQNDLLSILNINRLINFLSLDYLHEMSVEEQSIYGITYGSVLSLYLMKIFLMYLASAIQRYVESRHPYIYSSILTTTWYVDTFI